MRTPLSCQTGLLELHNKHESYCKKMKSFLYEGQADFNCSLFSFRTPSPILLSLSYGRDSASVPSHTLGPQRGTLCPQTFVLSATWKRSNKPSKLTILVWRSVYTCSNGFVLATVHVIYVIIGKHLCPICNRRIHNLLYDMIWYVPLTSTVKVAVLLPALLDTFTL